jgi:hypothetical protein
MQTGVRTHSLWAEEFKESLQGKLSTNFYIRKSLAINELAERKVINSTRLIPFEFGFDPFGFGCQARCVALNDRF